MNKGILRVLLSSLMVSSAAQAVNPVEGGYFGIMGGVGYMPGNSKFTTPYPISNPYPIPNPVPTQFGPVVPGQLSYQVMGGGGLELGYRLACWRLEFQPYIDVNYYKQYNVNGIIFKSPKNSSYVRVKGYTDLIAGFVNAYYDFLSPNTDKNFGAYLGLGVGVGRVQNNVAFYNNNVLISGTSFSTVQTSGVAQGIIGYEYWMDDFTMLGIDYRYITSRKINSLGKALQLDTLNLNLTFAFDSGS